MTIGAEKIQLDRRPNMVINRDYVPMLEERGLLDFERLYHSRDGAVVKQINERSILRLEVRHAKGTSVFFLKRHAAACPGFLTLVGAWFSGRSPSPGMAEFENICEFRQNSLPTVTPVAAGQRPSHFFRYESFLITEDIDPYIQLEKLIHDCPETLRGSKGNQRKRQLITAIARLAATMHDKGFNHRDFNATHVLIGPENDEGKTNLALFDLQRVDRKKWLRLKWGSKILAELFFSMPAPLFGEKDRILLYQTYHKTDRIRFVDRLLLFWIKRKTRRIARHTEKINLRKRSGQY